MGDAILVERLLVKRVRREVIELERDETFFTNEVAQSLGDGDNRIKVSARPPSRKRDSHTTSVTGS